MQAQGWGRIINISGSMDAAAPGSAASAAIRKPRCICMGQSDWHSDGLRRDTVQYVASRGASTVIRSASAYTFAMKPRRAFIAQHIPIGLANRKIWPIWRSILCSPLARYITGAVIP